MSRILTATLPQKWKVIHASVLFIYSQGYFTAVVRENNQLGVEPFCPLLVRRRELVTLIN